MNTLGMKGVLAKALVKRAKGWIMGTANADAHLSMNTNLRKQEPYMEVSPHEVQWIDNGPVVYSIRSNTSWRVR